MPESEGNSCVAIFYETVKKVAVMENGNIKDDDSEVLQNHCELVPKSYISSFGLNAESFVIRFRNRHGTPNLKLYFKTPKKQIEQLAGLVEHTTGRGLNVIEHFARLVNDQNEIKE